MMGISWGGFAALQVAARRPPSLGAICIASFTDDRYADDMHYMGGCLLSDNLAESGTMFAYSTCPPDPALVGDRWREMWRERLDAARPWIAEWLRHQRRDDYWRHASVCEDYSAIECPVLASSGWADGYSNAVLRLMASSTCRARADRPVVAQVPAPRRAGPGHRLPAGGRALVGPLAARTRTTACDGRADAAGRGCRTACRRRRPTRSVPAAGSGSAAGRRRTSARPCIPLARAPDRAGRTRGRRTTC